MPSLKRYVHSLVLLVGCRESSTDVRHDCEEAVARYHRPAPGAEAALARMLATPDVPAGRHDYVRAVAARATRQNERLGQMLMERCTADRWDAEMRGCIAADAKGCPDKLPPTQRAAFDTAFTALNAELVAEKKADRDPWNAELGGTCGSTTQTIARTAGALAEEADRDRFHAVMNACQRWHFTAVNCFGDATTPAALKRCARYLTPEQQAELHAALTPGPS